MHTWGVVLGRNTTLLDKIKDKNIRTWCAKGYIKNGYLINVFIHQIELNLYGRVILIQMEFKDNINDNVKKNYITRIKGVKIINFPNNDKKMILQKTFDINCTSNKFNVYKLTDIAKKDSCCNIEKENTKTEYLFGVDENGMKFTLFDCHIIFGINENEVYCTVIWQTLIYGIHKAINEININSISLEIEHSGWCLKNSDFISKFQLNENVHIENSVNSFPDKCGKERYYFGMKISFSSSNNTNIISLYDCAINYVEMMFFYIGYFPDFYYFVSEYNNEKIILFASNHMICYSRSNLGNYGKLFRIDKEKCDFNISFNKWKSLYNKHPNLFHLFFSINNGYHKRYEEEITSLAIQCLEGLFQIYFEQPPTRFDKKINKELSKEIEDMIPNINALKQIKPEEKVNQIKEGIK